MGTAMHFLVRRETGALNERPCTPSPHGSTTLLAAMTDVTPQSEDSCVLFAKNHAKTKNVLPYSGDIGIIILCFVWVLKQMVLVCVYQDGLLYNPLKSKGPL